MDRQYLRPKIILPIILGIIIGATLFFLGASDDAPGLSALGLLLGTGLVFFALHNMGKINPKIKANIIVPFFYGTLGLIGVIVLFFDNEFAGVLHFFFIALALCAGLIVIGIIQLRKKVWN